MARIASFEHVGVSLGDQRILSDVDFSLDTGQVVGISGPNGSGKTTLLRTLATLVRIDQGRAEILSIDIRGGEVVTIRPLIGLVGHSPTAIPHLTLRENLEHVAKLRSLEPSGVQHALEVVGLSEVAGRTAKHSSHGMQRRLEVARLLLTKPRLLLLDESLSGLDLAASELISALIERTISMAGSVVMVSHDRVLLTRMCDRLFDLDRGRLESSK